MTLEFTKDYWSHNVKNWEKLYVTFKPKTVLEIGSFEGRSACWIASAFHSVSSIDCIDSWSGGIEHVGFNMESVESRFDSNISKSMSKLSCRINKLKGESFFELSKLVGNKTYDLIYIDGSHNSWDVLSDSIISFRLLNVGGLMIWDDYLWSLNAQNRDIQRSPKLGIDSFMQCFRSKFDYLRFGSFEQLGIQKIKD